MIDRRHRSPAHQATSTVAAVVLGGVAILISACASQNGSALLPATSGLSGKSQTNTIVEPKVRVDATVAVASISGPPQVVWDRLIKQLNSATQDSHIALLNYQGATADYRLQGYIVAAPAKKNVAVSYIWDVFDKSGARVGRTAGSQNVDKSPDGDPWSGIPDPVLKLIADQAILAVRTRNMSQGIAKGATVPVTPVPEVPKRLVPRPAKPGTGPGKDTGAAAKPRREDAVLNASLISR